MAEEMLNMPTVYRVLTDSDKYQSVLADNFKDIRQLEFDGSPLRKAWTPPVVYSPYPLKHEGDFWAVFLNDSVFAVKSEVAPSIVTFLDQSCETLPLPVEGKTLLLCNVTFVLNCLDEGRSRHKPGIPHWIDDYVFHPRRFEYSLFKIPQTRLSEVLCVERFPGDEDGFKGTVENLGLTGLRFQMIWSDD